MHKLLLRVFGELEQEGFAYCLMRDADRLEQFAEGGEVDVLVQAGQFAALDRLLARLGFVRMPDRGYAPHHFFMHYDADSDTWLKLDVVTEVAYGRPVKNLRTDLAAHCLRHRRRSGPTYAPAPEDELMALLLHCVLDKGQIAPHRQERLQALRQEVTDEHYLTALLAAYWSPCRTWPQLAAEIDAEEWAALLAERSQVIDHLTRRDRRTARARQIRFRLLRQLNRWSALLRPSVPSVALLGPDGAGKSTLAEGIQKASLFPASQVYMGLYQKSAKRTPKRLPGIGFMLLLVTQWRRYFTARSRQARGQLVIFDRYPYDALLPSQRRLSWPKRVRRWMLAHACPPPDLVLVLDAPAETLYARKGEHDVDVLERQREAYLQLQARLPQVSVLDATRDAGQVRRSATVLIWQAFAHRHNHNHRHSNE